MIKCDAISVQYGNQDLALKKVSVNFTKGKIIGVIGPNGAGKSSLLKAILHLIPFEGRILIDGMPNAKALQTVAYVEQKSQVDLAFPITVKEFISLGLYAKKGVGKGLSTSDWQIVEAAAEQLGLIAFIHRPIHALSGGQFQRMLIARSLVQDATVYLLDEPFVGIDLVSEGIIMDLLHRLQEEGKTIVIIHHDLSKVKAYFDELLLLNQTVIAYGPTASVFNTANLKSCFGSQLVLESEVAHDSSLS